MPRSGGTHLDGTLGGGGHSALIAEQCLPGGILIGIDRDREALAAAGQRLACFGDGVRLVQGDFARVANHLETLGL